MNVRFGNLTISQFEKRTEVTFSEEDRVWLEEHRQDSANYDDPDKFHIFDMPFGIMTGRKCSDELVKRLTSGYKFKGQFTVFTVSNK